MAEALKTDLSDELAELKTKIAALENSNKQSFIMICGFICLFLQAGFGFLEMGSIRAKNAKNIMLKNYLDACIGGLVYWAFGYAFAYGSPNDGTGNEFSGGEITDFFFTHKIREDLPSDSDRWYDDWWFQYVFAAATATIVSGACAERMQFKGYIIYSAMLTGVLYPICAHWIWSEDGFLYKWGVVDFAGGGAVHMLSGALSFMAAMALGPRIGRYNADGTTNDINAHNTAHQALGVFILWFGFIPFIAGCGLEINGAMADITSRIVACCALGASSGGVVAVIFGYWQVGYTSLEHCMNGVLCGLVSVCSCCAVVEIWTLVVFVAPIAVLVYYGLMWTNAKIGVDDPLGASALHFGPGFVGMVAVGLFANSNTLDPYYGCEWPNRDGIGCDKMHGIFYGGTGEQLGFQLLASLIYTVYAIVTGGILFFGMKALGILRVSAEDERKGMDITHHGGYAYHYLNEEGVARDDPDVEMTTTEKITSMGSA